MVPDDTVHLSHNSPLLGTWGNLTFDISIAFYITTPFSFLFSLFYTTGISEGEGAAVVLYPSTLWRLPADTVDPYGHHHYLDNVSIFSLFILFMETARTHRIYGRGYSGLLKDQFPLVGGGARSKMPICITLPLQHGSDRLHMAPLMLLWLRPTHPPGLDLASCKIWDGWGFCLSQAIRVVQIGNCNLMLQTEMNILDEAYFHNRLR